MSLTSLSSTAMEPSPNETVVDQAHKSDSGSESSVQLQFVVGRFSLHCDGAERSETVVFLVSLTIFLLPRQS